MKCTSLDDLKNMYINKQFGYLTIIDVIRLPNGRVGFKCKCVCGNCKDIDKNKLLSGHTKSCGCYRKENGARQAQWYKDHQEELNKLKEKQREWYKQHPEEVAERAKHHSQWFKDNPDKVDDRNKKISQWFKDNPDKVKERSKAYSEWRANNASKVETQKKNLSISRHAYLSEHPEAIKILHENYSNYCKDKRLISNLDSLLSILHIDHVDDILHGNLLGIDTIKTKCPLCGEYDEHTLNNVFIFSKSVLKNGAPLCKACASVYKTSKYEQEIADYISTFYDGELIRNSRNIISPYELDLYYPEKKIAIEFNGDYYHSDNNKQHDYHINKYTKCANYNILLISIFESYWLSKYNEIKSYLLDTFNGNTNYLSYDKDMFMNNNYPDPNRPYKEDSLIIEDSYCFKDTFVHTCGYTKL